MKKFLIVLILGLNFMASSNAYADGCSFYRSLDGVGRLINETGQYAQINYEDGTETLALSVNLVGIKEIDKAVWIFPIPASPENTKIEIKEGFMEDNKSWIKLKDVYNLVLLRHFKFIIASQIYTALLFNDTTLFKDQLMEIDDKIKMIENSRRRVLADKSEKVGVIQSVNKYGLTSELISAGDATSLADYIKSKKVQLPDEFFKISNEYIGKKYLFVVSWFSDREEFKFQRNKITGADNIIEIYVKFKTTKIFFPLKMTSIYGNSKIPISISVNGYVNPELYPEIVSDIYKGEKIEQVQYDIDYYNHYSYMLENHYQYYYYQKNLYEKNYDNITHAFRDYFQNILFSKDANVYNAKKSTKIFIDVPSNNFKDDLWFSPSAPININFIHFMLNSNLLFGLITIALISCFSSLISAMICYRKYQPSKILFLLLGLSNIFTLIGFFICSSLLKVNKNFVKIETEGLVSSNPKGIIIFSLLFSGIFNILSVITFIILFRL